MIQQLRGTRDFLEESVEEMKKVTWPDWDQLKSATWVIIIFCILVSLVIWLMDIASRNLIDFIMGVFGA